MNKKKPSQPPISSAVIVAAGSSSRMGGKVRKPYLKLRGRQVLSWTVERLAKTPGLKEIVLVTRPEDRARAQRAVRSAKLPRGVHLNFAVGGARRMDSVYNGLRATMERAELVLIHDAARPFPLPDAIQRALVAARDNGAAILALPVRDTVKRQAESKKADAAPCASETVPRAGLWLAQTPQIFQRALILKLFARYFKECPGAEATDDAAVCEKFGVPVALIEAGAANLKLTRPEDLKLAEAFLRTDAV